MNSLELKERISNLSIWKKNGQRAPHKPLLILYALGQLTNNKKLSLPYEEVREELKSLLIEFGPARKSYHPEVSTANGNYPKSALEFSPLSAR